MGFYMVDYDAEVQIEVGGVQDGSPNWPTNPVSIKGIARRVSVEETAPEIEMSALADTVASFRLGKKSFRIEVEQLVANTGYFYRDTSGESLIGSYVRVTIKPSSSMAAGYQYIGVISNWSGEIRNNEVQVENCRIIGLAA